MSNLAEQIREALSMFALFNKPDRVRFNVMWVEPVRLPAVFGVGFQYDREAPAGMPNGQGILDSDPNNCGFRVVCSRPAPVAPVYWGQIPKSTTLRVSLAGASHGYWNPTPKNLHLARIKVTASVQHITLNRTQPELLNELLG